jgi:hypothetical protein
MVTMPTVPVEAHGIPTTLGLPDASDGFYVPIRLRLQADNDLLTAFYRLRYYIKGIPNPPNNNPVIAGIFMPPPNVNTCTLDLPPLVEGTPFPVHSGQKLTLCAVANGAESYKVLGEGAPQTVIETLSVSWFSTGGSFSDDVTGADTPDAGSNGTIRPNTTFTADTHLPATGSTIDVWAVVRDERGGTAITHRALVLQ